jgi:hypothetical protein
LDDEDHAQGRVALPPENLAGGELTSPQQVAKIIQIRPRNTREQRD